MMARRFGNKVHRLRAKRPRAAKVLSKEDPKYWEALLRREHLSKHAGQHKWLAYGHRVSALDYDGVSTYAIAAEDQGD